MVAAATPREASLMRGVLDMCVLAVLDVEPLHAYGVVGRLREHGFVNAGYGTIYPLVTRLKKQGLVEEQDVPSPSGPARKVLSTNTHGRAALHAWTEQWHRTSRSVAAVLAAGDKEGHGESHGR